MHIAVLRTAGGNQFRPDARSEFESRQREGGKLVMQQAVDGRFSKPLAFVACKVTMVAMQRLTAELPSGEFLDSGTTQASGFCVLANKPSDCPSSPPGMRRSSAPLHRCNAPMPGRSPRKSMSIAGEWSQRCKIYLISRH